MNYATVKEVFTDGVTLTFDDGSTSTKHFPCNSAMTFHAGDRVRISGSNERYVVEAPIGSPATTSTVADLATGATLATTVAKVNELLAALRARNLIN
jgi:hypothetical protein